MKSKLVFVIFAFLLAGVCSGALAVNLYIIDNSAWPNSRLVMKDSTTPYGTETELATGIPAVCGMVMEPAGTLLLTVNASLNTGVNKQVYRYDKTTGALLDNAVLTGTLPNGQHADGLCFDSEGRLYVVDDWYDWTAGHDKVMRYIYNDSTGKYDYDTSIALLMGPQFVTCGPGPNGNETLWVSTQGLGRLYAIDLTTLSATASYDNDGAAFNGTDQGIAISPNGKYLYMANYPYFNAILKLQIGVDTGFFTESSIVWDDGKSPYGMDIDSNGNIYVADGRSSRIAVGTGADTGAPVYVPGTGPLDPGSNIWLSFSPVFVAVDPPKPIISTATIDGAKGGTDGRVAILNDAIVTASFRNGSGPIGFAVENADRTAGIRIVSNAAVNPGQKVNIAGGVIATVNGERVIDASSGTVTVVSSGNTVPLPLGMSNKSTGGGTYLGQGAVADDAGSGKMSAGRNNVGLLERIWGTVTATNDTGAYDGYFYIDDGSGLSDGSGNIGIKCRASGSGATPDPLPTSGLVTVTGVMGVQQVGSVSTRYFWTVSWR